MNLRVSFPAVSKRILLSTAIIAAVLIALAPPEERLGHRYKLIYLHLPLLFFSIASFYISGFLIAKNRGKGLLTAGLLFALCNLVVVYFFERLTWGSFIVSEPRFYFMSAVYSAMAILLALAFIEKRLGLLFYAIATPLTLKIYLDVKRSAGFQLHPLSFVEMPLEMKLPMLFSFLTIAMIFSLLLQMLEKRFNLKP